MAHRRKTLSQNFLNRPATALRIVRAAAVGPDDLVLEPGPGTGTLTRHLGERARRVVAYELDPAPAARLSRRLADQPRVRVVRGDFLRARPPRAPFAVVGNIPYSRTSDIVRWCLDAPGLTSATLVTQWEYARARTGTGAGAGAGARAGDEKRLPPTAPTSTLNRRPAAPTHPS